MRFKIIHLLLLTVFIAVGVLTYQRYRTLSALQEQAVALRARYEDGRTRKADLETEVIDLQRRADYAVQLDSCRRPAIDSFKELAETHYKIEPAAGLVVGDYLPCLAEVIGSWTVHARLSIPDEYPVFLRTGLVENISRDVGERFLTTEDHELFGAKFFGEFDETEFNWERIRPEKIDGNRFWKLEPGLHDLKVTYSYVDDNGFSVYLDDQSVECELASKGDIGRFAWWENSAVGNGFEFDLRQGNLVLQHAKFGVASADLTIWLSTNPDVKGFREPGNE